MSDQPFAGFSSPYPPELAEGLVAHRQPPSGSALPLLTQALFAMRDVGILLIATSGQCADLPRCHRWDLLYSHLSHVLYRDLPCVSLMLYPRNLSTTHYVIAPRCSQRRSLLAMLRRYRQDDVTTAHVASFKLQERRDLLTPEQKTVLPTRRCLSHAKAKTSIQKPVFIRQQTSRSARDPDLVTDSCTQTYSGQSASVL